MSHTMKLSGNVTAHYNGDFSGNVIIIHDTQDHVEIEIPFSCILQLAGEWKRSRSIEFFEQAGDETALELHNEGIPVAEAATAAHRLKRRL